MFLNRLLLSFAREKQVSVRDFAISNEHRDLYVRHRLFDLTLVSFCELKVQRVLLDFQNVHLKFLHFT